MTTKPSNQQFKHIDILLIIVILLIAFVSRLYKIDNPVADWHSWRQADSAAVARNFVRSGFDLLHPRYDDLGSNQTGRNNPEGYRFVEFPFYNASFALLYKILPLLPLEMYGRLTSALFSLLLIVILYLLALYEENRIAAFFSALVFAIMPFFVFYSRVILPEMTATSLIFAGIFFLYLFTEKNRFSKISVILLILSAMCTALALLTKPTTIFYLLPIIYLFYLKWGLKSIKNIRVYIYFAVVLIPFIAWRLWIRQFPEGIPASQWLITSVNTFEGQKNIFFRPAFFRWIFYERIATMILGGYLLGFLTLGILKKAKKNLLFISIGIASLAYLFTFQGGNVQHDYYQTLILPSLALFSGLGIGHLFTKRKNYTNLVAITTVVILFLAMAVAFSYYKVKDLYWTDPDLLSIAKIVKTVTEPNSKLVTDRNGDTTLLYLADRKGYAAITEDLDSLKNKGMEYFVTLNKEVADNVKKETKFRIIFENDKVFIFKL